MRNCFNEERILSPRAIEINPDNPSTQFNGPEQSMATGWHGNGGGAQA
jgi:hypothetical protein